MKPSIKILSTKLLSEAEKLPLLSYDYTEKAFITISLKRDVLVEETIDYAVFTSQNAVKSVFNASKNNTKYFKKVFCVGHKTAQLLKTFNIESSIVCLNATELAKALIEMVSSSSTITFFCGNLRRDELPNLLREHQIEVRELEVYTTELNSMHMDETYDAVLFFSPSAVKSYVKSGNDVQTLALCIGNTTAVAAIMEFENVYVAETPTTESVLELLSEVLPKVKRLDS
ncbi:MAG: uroporphyrinogen-III synthase [Flavicella sp.]